MRNSQLAKLKKEKARLEGPFAEEILAAMKRLGMRRLEEFADAFGLGRTTVYNLVLGRKVGNKWIKPSLDTVVRLSLALNIPVEDLIAKLYEDEVPTLGQREEVHVPVVGYVGGGPSQLEEIEERTVPVRVKGDARHLAAFKVRGNSMCAGKRPICHGDVIIVNTEDKGHPGAIVVARLENGEYVVKLLKNGALYSTNPEENGPPVIPLDQVAEIVGRVVEVRSRL
ncbi:helix-turn-helix domain-containing protein [Thermus hydrothermalis]|uniref:LexA repressor n=2 Tax=Thermus TaxID=270 RepID=A0A1J0LXH0_THEBO|nr:LexA repressor [Thermus brockianus]TFU17550.1 LexA family transcriptional regulator [Thermus tengchongensis]